MEDYQVSRTAQMTAFSRGYHYENDSPRIFDDRLANHFLTQEERASIEEQIMAALRTINPVSASAFPDQAAALRWMMHASAAAPIVLARARYAEDLLEKVMSEGVGQYVILGAGLDTFSFRRPDLLKNLTVFELDHPATQMYKRKRIQDLGWEHPPNLSYIPVDFTRDSLASALKCSTFDPQIPTFFSWLGVTYYLSPNDIFATLRDIACIAPAGSSIVFDYLDTEAYIPEKAAPRVMRMLWSVREVGEPMLSGFEPLMIAEELKGVGFCLQEDLSPWDIHSRYFLGRTDHYRACEHTHFAYAVVG
jgi:methyltransferase (TIGR00027 family)